jgi:LPXTG-motif cell wall-anchored protein
VSRWRKALIAASVGAAASTAFVVTSSIPGQAETSLVATYRCIDGIAGAGVDIEATITPQIEAGGLMNVRWGIAYKGNPRFGSPGFFPAGSSLDLEGVVDISGAWVGQLRPRGGQEQGELVPGEFLELPEGLSDQGSIGRSGTVRFKPGALTVRFTPAEGEVMVNNNAPDITYAGDWKRRTTAEEFGDHLYDLHRTRTQDAKATLNFTGTKVAYIARRERGLGKIQVKLDGETVTDPLVEPGKDRDGTEMTGTASKEVLWESPELEYGPHILEIINTEAKVAYVDAFRVTVSDITEPPAHDQATCELQGDPGAIDVTVPGPTEDPTDPPTEDPSEDPTDDPDDDPSDEPTDEDSTPPEGDSIGGDHVAVVPTVSPSSSSTPKSSSSPTATRYYRAQVPKTPKGGVDSGEAPATGEEPTLGLMTSGAVLMVGSVGGGLLLRRRRAAHVGGAGR